MGIHSGMPQFANAHNGLRVTPIAIIGLGYVGLPLAQAFVADGRSVLGFDVDPAKIDAVARGETYLKHLGERFIADMTATGRLHATCDFDRLAECSSIVICVPTPLNPNNEPDLSYVEKTAEAIARSLRPGQLIVLESTSYPRTTRDVVLPILERTSLKCGTPDGFYLAFSPEREDPGRKDHTTATIPKLVGGVDAESGRRAVELYRGAFKTVVPVSSAEVAEAAKILENTYRAVNIALVNELKVLFTKMGIDIWEVIEAAKTKPFGFQAFYPGPGLGGHCIPIDPFYLAWQARQMGTPSRFIELAGEINHAMPGYVVSRLVEALKTRGVQTRGARVLVLGLAYKPNIDDVRESPSFEIIEELRDLGAIVDYNDPHVPKTHTMRKYDLKLESVALSPVMLASYDAVIICTHHDAYDWAMIAQHARLFVDTRGVMRGGPGGNGKVVGA